MYKLLIILFIFSQNVLASKLKMGIVLNSQGKFQVTRAPILKGIKLFFKDKKDVDLEFFDPDDTLEGQQKVAEEIVKKKIKFILGHNFSSIATLFLKSVPKDYEMSYVTPLATSLQLLDLNENVFIPWTNNEIQVDAMVNFLGSLKKKYKTIVMIINESEPYSTEMASFFQNKILKLGNIEIKRVSYLKDKLNINEVLKETFSYKPDVVFIPSYSYELLQIYNATTEKPFSENPQPIFISGDTIGQMDVVKEKLGANLDKIKGNFYFTNGWAKEIQNSENKKFVEKYRKAYGEDPVNGSAAGYDGARVLYEAIKKSKSKTVSEVNKILSTLSLDSVVGKIQMTPKRTMSRKVVIYQINKNGFVFNGMK